ncbi:MAG: hypothetical protein AAFR58_18120 [Cyanobacteria bacterium J06627_28]
MQPIDLAQKQLETLPPEKLEAIQGLLTGWLAKAENETKRISKDTAQTVVNDWLLSVLGDRFTAITPHLIAGGDIWSVSVGLAYPNIGIIGETGEVLVSAFSRGIISATDIETMKAVGVEHFQAHKHEIEAAFLSTGNA